MRNASLIAVVLFLHSNCGSALFPGVKHIHSKRGMSGLRRRLTRSSVPKADTSRDQPSIGSRFWKRKSGSISNRTKLQEKGEKDVEPSRRGDDLLLSISDVIHLGKLQIPPSRRLSLTTTRSLPDVSANSIAVAQRPSLLLEDDKIAVDAPSEARKGNVGIDGTSSSVASLVTGGDPSVIPCGVSGDNLDMGVVQIPLRFTVGETVKFIRAVATEDQDSSRTVEPAAAAGGRVAAERGVVAEASEVLPGLLHDSDKRQTTLSSRIYVTEDGKLRGFITMASLLTHQPETPVRNLLLEMKELLREGDIWEDAVHRLRLANVMAAPVVDSDGILVAVVNPGDLMKEMEIEATDDIMRQSGSGGGETYFGTPLPRLVASRVGWLVSLLCLQSLSSLILQNYQHVIEKNMVIALFLTMLTGTAGNAGNQARSSAIVIRGLATGEINQRNRWRVIWRESRAAVASAVVLSFAAFGRVYMTPGATTVATLAVAMAMGATVIGAVLFGTVAPIVLDGMGVDPVNFASPALATLTDVSGVFILCSIAKMMLRNVG
ncbi:unnamed protein product [Ascophyllum nodosum]